MTGIENSRAENSPFQAPQEPLPSANRKSYGRQVKNRAALQDSTNTYRNALERPQEMASPSKPRDWKIMRKELVPHHRLLTLSTELKKSSENSPLTHFNPASLNAKDLYMNDNVVFKPGREEAVMSKLGYMVTWMAGLQGAVAPSKQGTATVISREDQDETGRDKEYLFARIGDRLTIVDSKEIRNDKIPVAVFQSNEGLSIELNDTTYALTASNEGFSIATPKTEFDQLLEKETFAKLSNQEEEVFAAPKSHIFAITQENDKKFVEIHDVQYEVVEDLEDEGVFKLEGPDEKIADAQYQEFIDSEGNSVLSSSTSYIPYDPDEGELIAEGKSYTVEEADGELTITAKQTDPYKGKQFVLIEDGQQSYVVQTKKIDRETLQKASTVIDKGTGNQAVMRNGQEYQLQ
ncbi:MAG: hypothetical protein JSR46_05970, partial [Verrucomicrobia bacterium]|nr:hypothetical protein [Verrucomicrobiota bacterium]